MEETCCNNEKAMFKFYITANLKVRARRYPNSKLNKNILYKEVLKSLKIGII